MLSVLRRGINLQFLSGLNVAVVDDKWDEVSDLIRTLGLNSVYSVYIDGGPHARSSLKYFRKTRVVFLDIILDESKVDSKTDSATAANVVNKIIPKDNGPYAVIAWTKDSEYLEHLKGYLGGIENPPIFVTGINKEDVKDSDGGYDVLEISNFLTQALTDGKLESFIVFCLWEQMTGNAVCDILSDFSSMGRKEAEWNEDIKKILFSLAKSVNPYGGSNSAEIVRYSLLGFARIFSDTLENRILSDINETNTENIVFTQTSSGGQQEIANDIRAKIHSKMWISRNSQKRNTGNVFSSTDRVILPDFDNYFTFSPKKTGSAFAEYVRAIITELIQDCPAANKGLDENQLNKVKKNCKSPDSIAKNGYNDLYEKYCSDCIKNSIQEVICDVTPACDHAQNKAKYQRMLHGILFLEEFPFQCRQSEYIYCKQFEHSGQICNLLLDLRKFRTYPLDEFDGREVLFRLRHDIVADIQQKVANHVGRIGIIEIP